MRATSPSYCTSFAQSEAACGFPEGTSNLACARYICYAGGDCSNGGDDCKGDLTKLPDLNGGWYGKIGDFFPSLANANKFPTICTGDSIDVAARFYATEREYPGSATGFEYEGINTSFKCNDTLISAPNDSACNSLIARLKGFGIKIDPNADPNEIADHQMIRPLAVADVNTVLAASDDSFDNGVFANYCGAGTVNPDPDPDPDPTVFTHTCSCTYKQDGTGTESVTGSVYPKGKKEIGCCTLSGCDLSKPTVLPNSRKFEYSCPIPVPLP